MIQKTKPILLILALIIGGTARASAQGIHLGNANPTSGDISLEGDLFTTGDIEVADALYLSRTVYMEGNGSSGFEGDQFLYFYDDGSRSRNYLQWDEIRSDASCSGTSATTEAFVWNIADNSETAFLLTNGDDIELKLDDFGELVIDGTFTQSGSCDLAETFLGPELAAGTVVVADPQTPEGVLASSSAYQATVVGVVSTDPGILLNGPTADFYERAWEIDLVRAEVAREPENEALEARKTELERMRDEWPRGNVPVALVGRVPVLVDGAYGEIRAGDPLTTSPTPGHAMALRQAGPMLGVALEDFAGERGSILVLLRTGWHSPPGSDLAAAEAHARIDRVRTELTAEIRELAAENLALRHLLADRGERSAHRELELERRLGKLEAAMQRLAAGRGETLPARTAASLEPAGP